VTVVPVKLALDGIAAMNASGYFHMGAESPWPGT
jgi:hypothetical protein